MAEQNKLELSPMEVELLQTLAKYNPYSFKELSAVYLRQKLRSLDKLLMAIELSQAENTCINEYRDGPYHIINPDVFENKMGTDRVPGKCSIRGCRGDASACFGGLVVCEKHFDDFETCCKVSFGKEETHENE